VIARDPREREARAVYRALFQRDPSEELVERYVAALDGVSLAEWPAIDFAALVDHGVDLEALEIAARRRNRRNAVTQRFQVVSYLAEAQAAHFNQFVNDRQQFLAATITLSAHLLRSIYKLLKGRRLLAVYANR